jgi:hypothetical protein
LKGVRRKGKIEFAKESDLLILIKRITKAQSKERMKRIAISLVMWRLRMEDCRGKGLNTRSPLMRNLVVRGVKERGLIDRDDTGTSLTMMSLSIASMT